MTDLPLLALAFRTDPPTPLLHALSLHDALPICRQPSGLGGRCASGRRLAPDARSRPRSAVHACPGGAAGFHRGAGGGGPRDRKSTRLNSSHSQISYAVFCLKKKISPNSNRVVAL